MIPFFALTGQSGIQRISAITDSGAASATPTLDVSGMDLQEDDVLVVFFSCTGVDEAFNMTGFQNVADIYETDTTNTNLHVGYKVQTSTPDTSVTIGPALSSTQPYTVVAFNFRGVDTSNVLDVSAQTFDIGSTLIINPPSITPVTGGAMVVSGGGSGTDASATYSSSDLSGLETASQSGGSDFSNIAVGFSKLTTNPAAFTSSLSNNTIYSTCACTLALRPA